MTSDNLDNSYDSSVNDSTMAGGGTQKIKLMEDFIGSGNFPFGADLDSSTTELSLNLLRVQSMCKIMYERTLEKIPGISSLAIEETVLKFGHYANFFGRLVLQDDLTMDKLTLRMYIFFFLHQLIFYVIKVESLNYD